MADAPYTKRRYVQYRGPSTSDDYNKRIEEAYNDLVVLYNRSRLANVELEELYRRMVKDQVSLTREIDDLESRIQSLEINDNRLTFHSDEQIDTDFFNGTTFEVPTEERLSFDGTHGFLTLPKLVNSSVSKFTFVDKDGEEVVPPGIETRVVGDPATADNATSNIDSSDVTHALLRKPGMIWERNVVVNTPDSDGAEMDVYIRVPVEISATNKANAISLSPFPAYGVTIKDISYTTRVDPMLQESDGYVNLNANEHYSGDNDAVGWVVPGGWTGTNENKDWILNSGPRMFYFNPKDITAIRITLHQDDYIHEDADYVYSYGSSRFDLRHDKFMSSGKTILHLDDDVMSVDSVAPEIYNVSSSKIEDVFSYRILAETSPGSGVYEVVDDETFIGGQDTYIEVTLQNTDGWTPALSGLTVEYS